MKVSAQSSFACASFCPSFGRRSKRKRTNTTSSTQSLGDEVKRTATQAVINGVVNIGFKYVARQFGLPI